MRPSTRTVASLALSVALATSCKDRITQSAQRSSAPSGHRPVAASSAPTDLRDGDLIFQESTSGQSEMVRALTKSRWTHMGVIFNEAAGTVVFEAVSPVRKTPLARWIERGRDRRYVVKRLRDADSILSPEVVGKMRKISATWMGRPYDVRFRWDDESLYCSELAYKLFERASGRHVGNLQRAADLNLDDPRVQKAIRKRFANVTFNPIETVVTPDSIFNDEQLFEVKP